MIQGTNQRNNNTITLPHKIEIDHTDIEHVNIYKYLGLNLNSQLTSKEYTNKTIGYM